MFKDDPKGKTHADVPAHFYQKGYDEGRLDVLNHLLQIADECEYEELRREVQGYADIHDIQIGEPVTYKN
jgi:cobalamin biosynthesis Co2+ chelatase CbiK